MVANCRAEKMGEAPLPSPDGSFTHPQDNFHFLPSLVHSQRPFANPLFHRAFLHVRCYFKKKRYFVSQSSLLALWLRSGQ